MDTLSVCNLALAHLGQPTLSSSDLSAHVLPSSKACNLYFDPCRDDVYREFNWPFAKTKDTLVLSDVVDADSFPDWAYYYNYPSGTSNIWYVYNSATVNDRDNQDYEKIYVTSLDSYFIGSNLSDCYVEYTSTITDPAKWDSKFLLAFSYNLASRIAKWITGDEGLSEKMASYYYGHLSEAKRIASQEKRKKVDRNSAYQDSR